MRAFEFEVLLLISTGSSVFSAFSVTGNILFTILWLNVNNKYWRLDGSFRCKLSL